MLYFTAAIFLLVAIVAGVLSTFLLERMFLEGLEPRRRSPRQVGAANSAERAQAVAAGFWRTLRDIRLRA
jgi:hypothetical protein